MTSWKGALGALLVLVALGAVAWQLNRSAPAPHRAAPLFDCDVTNALDVHVVAPAGREVEVARASVRDSWYVEKPVAHVYADQELARGLVEDMHALDPPINVIASPSAPSTYGLDAPREVVTCRTESTASITLTVGKESFDGSGYYATRGGDPKVYVLSLVPVDDFDRRLATPPVSAAPPSPGASPSPSR